MMTQELYDRALKYKGDIDTESIIEFLFNKSVWELKREQAVRNWDKPYTMDDIETLFEDDEFLIEERHEFNSFLRDKTKEYLSKFMENPDADFLEDIWFDEDAQNAILTFQMHEKFPETKEYDIKELIAMINDYVDSQELTVVKIIEEDIIPKLI
jgi:hypothetical protein